MQNWNREVNELARKRKKAVRETRPLSKQTLMQWQDPLQGMRAGMRESLLNLYIRVGLSIQGLAIFFGLALLLFAYLMESNITIIDVALAIGLASVIGLLLFMTYLIRSELKRRRMLKNWNTRVRLTNQGIEYEVKEEIFFWPFDQISEVRFELDRDRMREVRRVLMIVSDQPQSFELADTVDLQDVKSYFEKYGFKWVDAG